ncbi:NUDIX domain-containing protein [Roseibium denhamense]|uniref:NUDIX domain-containing protein n=1 Tax=Roseibium denhamense TaxID=76305 RepID=A0ABY1P8H4_9HYPH|nr:NUDIX domain-containing protein [Roseibium denhamense]MTI04452.1 NUDIX domain-containing protein [Roseibium denhamense]SMP28458.1 NUDIX domain-containing protein [Roseibium denhamense]
MQVLYKAYVYLTCGPELLVFSEPDSPEVGLQIPGGTLDPGESFLQGARREFFEETGLSLDIAIESFADQDHIPEDGSVYLSGVHRRRHFHGVLKAKPAETWDHFEMTPSAGGPPIRFRLFWIDVLSSKAPEDGLLSQGFGAQLETLRPRMERQINGCH